jgi:phospholipid/cholesterol/gamma-HCH transport system permease protein
VSETGLQRAGEPRVESLGSAVRLAGTWTLDRIVPRRDALQAELRAHADRGHWDATAIDVLDATGAAMLWNAWGRRRPVHVELRPEMEELLTRLDSTPAPAVRAERAPWSRFGTVRSLGRAALGAVGHARGLLTLLGQVLLDLVSLAAHPGRGPWRELSAHLFRAGATALPITAMVGFLIGIVVSYLSAQQLRTYGANVLIVNLLGISILRELGPLLAAILVAGRSGSSITAQIGVMHVTQELDALAALGIPATLRLVLPRVLALMLALPLLVVWTDAVALLGGILASELELGIGLSHFVSRLPDVVPAVNLWIGVGKGAVFGALIALVACHYGLRVEPNTESLGAGTTASVVTSITLVLVADAVFAVALAGVGLGALH